MKKIIIAVIILLVAVSGGFAQDNTVYGGVGLGVGIPCIIDGEVFISYEHSIIPQLSVGGSVAFQMYPLATFAMVFDDLLGGEDVVESIFTPIIEAQVHWYPFEGSFHVDLGLGYANYLSSMDTFLIAPGLGWLFDFGEPGGFVVNIGLRTEFFIPFGDSIIKKDNGDDLIPVNYLTFRLGLGYRF